MPKASHLYRSGTISRKTDKPTHPEKLLWAANGFQESRYYVSVKQMWKKKKMEKHTSFSSPHIKTNIDRLKRDYRIPPKSKWMQGE